MEKELNRLYKNLWITKGCRFIASKRYTKHNHLANITITIASVYILAMNLLILIEDRLEIFSSDNINYFTICASILVLALSLIVNSRNYQSLADKFHDCGRELSEVYDSICLLKTSTQKPSEEEIKIIHSRYHNIIRNYDINQDQLDFNLFKARNINDFYSYLSISDNDEHKWMKILSNIKTFVFRQWFTIKTYAEYTIHQYFIYSVIWALPFFLLLVQST
ncbi:SLATT domain-containing protein [uncultured Tenacibaculum sp.]|uniref:SLATT domain-containing protein n=1 Tax=uncultured Tenacibaculum sp. TaxID=174713 RepID=UPI002623839D|nr:SLATT domain-containing protein [uncultured Tenacibaculum sp.]